MAPRTKKETKKKNHSRNLANSIAKFKQKDNKLFDAKVILRKLEPFDLGDLTFKTAMQRGICKNSAPSALNISSTGKDTLSLISEARRSLRKTCKYAIERKYVNRVNQQL